MSNNVKLSVLRLVFPPISNQGAYLIENNSSVKEYLKQSDFYMIGGKKHATFANINIKEESLVISFDFSIGNEIEDSGSIDVFNLYCMSSKIEQNDFKFSIRYGRMAIEILNDSGLTIERFTPEMVLWLKSQNVSGISGLNKYKELSIYDLLYVGIAKVGDSYDRLIAQGHHARMKILSNEKIRHPGARVSDETFLFFFKIEPLFIATYDAESNFDNLEADLNYELKKIVADAEKAFVHLLEPNYNEVKFKQYPKGKDGLYDSNLNRYGYMIGENLTFVTPNAAIKGSYDPFTGISNEADCIHVNGDDVILHVAGKDFPSE